MPVKEQGLVELDAPGADYLRAYRLIPASTGFGPVTLRHLLTHTAGIRAVRTVTDLLRPALGYGMLTDPQLRILGGVEVAVRRGNLILRGRIPVPAVRKGLRLHPDGDDPDAFRVDLPGYGSGTSTVVFSRRPGGQVAALHLGFFPLSFRERR